MADLLSLLGMGAVAKTRADTATLEGQQVKRDREQKDLLTQLAQQRQREQDAAAAQMQALQRRDLLSRIEERAAPPDETFGQPFEAMEGGKPVFVERGNRGTTRTLPGYTPPQKPVTTAPSVTPQRGASLPAPAIEKMIELDDLIGMTKRARLSLAGAVREGRNVTGRVGGVIPVKNWMRNAVGQGGDVGTGVRGELANVSSTIMKLRSGAAVSDQEFARLEPFLASDDDDESVAMIKLRKLAQALEEMKRIRLENYQRYGKPGVVTPRGEDPETGVDMDEALDSFLGRKP